MGLKIVGFASLLVESDSKEERREYINIMQENTDLLLQLISDILDLSKIEAGTLEFTMDHLNVKSFCEDIMRNYDIKEDKAVPVLLASNLPDYCIYTDKKRLMQVITTFKRLFHLFQIGILALYYLQYFFIRLPQIRNHDWLTSRSVSR